MENTFWFGKQKHRGGNFYNMQKPRTLFYHYVEQRSGQIKSQVYKDSLNINILYVELLLLLFKYTTTKNTIATV